MFNCNCYASQWLESDNLEDTVAVSLRPKSQKRYYRLIGLNFLISCFDVTAA